MPLPQAVCVGPMKTSTTWLYRQLQSVPEIWMCPVKELHFLDYMNESVDSPSPIQAQGYQRKLHILQSNIQRIMQTDHVTREDVERLKTFAQAALADRFDYDWYESFYEKAPEDKLIIEIAPTYSFATDPNVQLFAKYIGQATKIIFILRNPIDRWLSQGRFDLKVAIDQKLTEQTVPFVAELLSKKWRQIGGYKEYIETWEKHFPNLIFIYHDELHASDGTGVLQICESLNVPANITGFRDFEKRVNSQGNSDFPIALRTWVASEHMDELEWLASRFGERAEQWRDEALALMKS